MTCKEKLIQDHPDWSEAKVNGVIREECPEQYMNIGDPDWCSHSLNACKKCWDREIPETKNTDPVPVTKTEYDNLLTSGTIDSHVMYWVYNAEQEVLDAEEHLAAKRTYTTPETSVENTQCITCTHKDVCMHREDFLKVMKAAQHSDGIVANIELFGGYQDTIDLMSEEYLKVDISCKHYHRKADIRYGI